MDVKSILSFLAGGIIGSVATYFVVKDKIYAKANDDISQMEKTFKKKYCSEEEISTDISKENEPVSEEVPVPKTPTTSTKDTVIKPNKTQYNKYAAVKQKILGKAEDLIYNDDMDLKLARVKKGDRKKMYEPIIISEDEFIELQNEDGWDSMEVFYDPSCVDGNYFSNADGEEISVDSVGREAMDFMNSSMYEDEVIYVKNDEINMVFEVSFDQKVDCDFDA